MVITLVLAFGLAGALGSFGVLLAYLYGESQR